MVFSIFPIISINSSHFHILVGDNESGKTSLVARLQGTEDPKKGAGLEYHYINVKDDYRDGTYNNN